MPNYSVVLGVGSYAETSTFPAIDATSAIGFTGQIKGDRLKTPGSNASFGAILEGKAGHIGLNASDGTTANLLLDLTSIVSPAIQASIAKASIDATKRYRYRIWHDTAQPSNKQGVELWDDTDTLIASAYGSDANAIPANPGFGYYRVNMNGSGGASTSALEVDWHAIWTGMPPAGAPTEPAAGAAGLVEVFPDDEGSGNTLTGSKTAEVMAITDGAGGHSWNNLSGGGVVTQVIVTIDRASCMVGGGGNVTVVLKDSLGAVVSQAGRTAVTLSSANTNIVSTTNSPLQTHGVAVGGPVTITATDPDSGVTGTASFSVANPSYFAIITGTATRGTTNITPELPRDAASISNSLADKVPTGADVVLGANPTGAEVSAAILANPDSKIIVPSGSTITGKIVAAKEPGHGYSWVCSSNASPEGTVMTPTNEAIYGPPVVVSPNHESGIVGSDTPGLVPYKIVFKDLVVRPNNATETGSVKALIAMLASTATGGTNIPLTDFPSDIYFSSVSAKGYPGADINGGFQIRARRFGLRGCVATDIHDSNAIDASAFQLLDAPGPYIIEDWIISATGEPFESGGQDSDLNERRVGAQGGIIRRGVSFKPTSWKGVWAVKNGFLEFKTADQVLIEDIVSDYCFSSAQAGDAAQFWSVNQSGTQPWARMRNVTLRRMWVRNHPGSLRYPATAAGSGGGDSLMPICMSARDIVATGMGDAITDYTDTSHDNYGLQVSIKNEAIDFSGFGPSELELRNITHFIKSGRMALGLFGGGTMRNFQFHSNLIGGAADSYYLTFDSRASGDTLWSALATGPHARWAKNLIAGSHAANRILVGSSGNDYRNADSDLNVVDYTRAADINCTIDQLSDLVLNANDPMKGQGEDGTDPGCNIAAVQAGVSSIWATYLAGGF